MRIGIDIDNTINDLCRAVLKVYNEDSGDLLSYNMITSYYIEDFVKPNYKDNFYKYFSDSRVWKNTKLSNMAQKFITKLFNEGDEILFITKTEPRNYLKKYSWLERNFPFLNIRKCFFNCPNKKIMSLDIMVDDCLDNLGGCQLNSIIVDSPWNQLESEPENFFRCSNWEEIYITIQKIKEKR